LNNPYFSFALLATSFDHHGHLQANIVKKGKAIPLQAWTGPEVFKRFSLPDFKTFGT
jgi:hypothetical protein